MPDSTSPNPCCQEYIAQINQLTQQLEENDKQLEDVTNKLQQVLQVQRLHDRSTQYATDLQDQIDRLNLELQGCHRTSVVGDVCVPDVAKPKSEVSVVHTGTQTEYNDTDVQCVHKDTDIGTQAIRGTELGARPSQFTDPQDSSSKNEFQMHSPGDSTELMAAWAPSNEDPEEGEIPQEKQSIADSLREAAEEAQQLTGFVFDQSTGLYYDNTSGYYYDAEKSLYYEPYSGTYYYFDTTKNTYEFHSKADFSNYSEEAYSRYYKNVTGQKLKKKKKDKEKETKKETSEKSSKRVRRKKRKKTEDNSDDGSEEDSSRSKKRRKKHKKEKYHKKEKHRKHKKAHKHSKHHHRKPLRDNIDKNVISDSTEKVELTADTKISPLHDTEYVTSIPSDPDYKHDEPNKHTSSMTSLVDTNTSDHETSPLRSPENNICSETVKTEQLETASTNNLSDGEIESEYSTPTDIQTDTGTKILHTDDICMDFEEGEVIASSSNEEISITDSDTQSSSSEEIEDSSTSSSEDEDDIQEISARNYPPCIRAIVKESEELDKGCLHIITYSGATIGRDKELKHSILLTDVQISKMHCDIKYNEELRRYEVMDHASQNGTFVNGHRLAQPKVLSEPYPLTHNDQLTIGGTTLEIHVHPGTQTCDGCEPGLVREKVNSEDTKESDNLSIASKAEKEKLRRQQLRQIKKKYGLATEDFTQTNPHNPAYKDKAAERRRVVGSDNPHQKDDVPASVHRAISTENKGHKLLAKMGWKTGDSLGKSQTGIMEPIQVQFRTNQSAGLGSFGAHSASLDHVADAQSKKNWIKAQKRFHNLDRMPNVQTDNSTKPGTPGKIQFSLGQTITPEDHKQQNPDLTFKSQGHGQLSCLVKLKHESGGRLEHSTSPEHTQTKITTTSTTVGPIKWAKGRTKVGQKVVASHNVTDVFGQESSDDEDPG